MDKNFPTTRLTDIGNIYKGPYSNRKLTQVSYVEFGSRQTCSNFLAKVEKVKFPDINGKNILIKQARTKFSSTRNYHLRKAHEIIQSNEVTDAHRAEIDWKERHVHINKVVVFFQNKTEEDGTFAGPCSHLAFPRGGPSLQTNIPR